MIVIGIKGHFNDLITDSSFKINFKEDVFFDDQSKNFDELNDLHVKVITSIEDLKKYHPKGSFTILVGNPHARSLLYSKFTDLEYSPANLLSNKALFSSKQDFIGCNFMPFSSVFYSSIIGKGVLINSYASVHHNAIVGDFSVISPGARLLGHSKLGKQVFVGAGAIILPYINIGDHAYIGAGAVVREDVVDGAKVVGNPAREI